MTASKKAADLDILTVECLNRGVYGETKLNLVFMKTSEGQQNSQR